MIQANSLQVAETFNLKDRGKLSPGYFAGVIVFNEKTISDRATYDNPEVFAEGMKYVIVSGKMAMFSSKPRIAEERNNFGSLGIAVKAPNIWWSIQSLGKTTDLTDQKRIV